MASSTPTTCCRKCAHVVSSVPHPSKLTDAAFPHTLPHLAPPPHTRPRYNPPSNLHNNPTVHALGIAAYVCSSSFASAATMTPAQLVAECDASLPASRALFARFRDLAAAEGLGIVTYESGVSMMEASAISSGSFTLPITQKFIAAHREPALRGVYVKCRMSSVAFIGCSL